MKRIIPCLDIRDGRVVKGIRFENLRDSGDPVEQACCYEEQGADELVVLDVTATAEGRRTLVSVVRAVAERIAIPFTVGGGVREISDAAKLLENGADRIAINTAALASPGIISEMAEAFGSQCVVVAVDVRQAKGEWWAYSHSGSRRMPWTARAWAAEAADRGAGELLVTAIDRDGTKLGFDIPLMRTIGTAVSIPVIASGGAGVIEHFVQVFRDASVDAALAASLFHNRHLDIGALKTALANAQIPVRRYE